MSWQQQAADSGDQQQLLALRQVKSSRRCTSAEPPSPEGPPLQLDRSISGPGMCLPHPAALLRASQLEPSRLGAPAAALRCACRHRTMYTPLTTVLSLQRTSPR